MQTTLSEPYSRRPGDVRSLRFSLHHLLLTFNLILLFWVNPPSVFSFAAMFGLVLLLHQAADTDKKYYGLLLFQVYCVFALLLHQANISVYGQIFGFLGVGGLSADDSYYFYHATPALPDEYPNLLIYPTDVAHPFSQFLRIFTYPLYFFTGQLHLIDAVLINVVVLSLIPTFTAKTALLLTEDAKVARTAYLLTAICPLLLGHGLVLLRDTWAALLIIASIYFFLQKNFLRFGLLAALLFFLRPTSGVLLIILISTYAFFSPRQRQHPIIRFLLLYFTVAFAVIGFIVIYPTLERLFGSVEFLIESTFFRTTFVQQFLGTQVTASGGVSPFLTISEQPFFIRIPLGFAFFLFGPYFSPADWTAEGNVRPHLAVVGGFAVLMILFYARYFTAAIVKIVAVRHISLRITALGFLLSILLLSQLSTQLRHKTWVMPLFYILVAYGYHHGSRSGRILGWLIMLALFWAQLIVNALDFL